MSQISKSGQTENAKVLKNEIRRGANTKLRVYNLLQDLIDSSVSFEQVVQTTGTSETNVVSQKGLSAILTGLTTTSTPKVLVMACSDEGSPVTTGTSKITFRMPYAMTLNEIRASLTTAQASGSILTVNIKKNGVTILSTKVTIDNTEKTSKTAATPPVISIVELVDDDEITIDVDQVGNGTATGLKVTLIGV